MPKITIADSNDLFLENGKPFFYVADTFWSAFTGPSFDEWEQYLDLRRGQGFNAIQINVLPQLEASSQKNYCLPYELDQDGHYNYAKINPGYWARARAMLEMAAKKGFLPVLVLLWCNYVPGTWGSRDFCVPPMPFEAIEGYVDHVVKVFGEYSPIYFISGDTDFTDLSSRYYLKALQIIKDKQPDSLTSMHIMGETGDLPEIFAQTGLLDFYTYQSGHNRKGQHCAYSLAESFYKKEIKKPIINAEPCYEGHGYGNEYGRFSAFDVRRAVWQSLLSGAKAGISYGAHGVWNYHRHHSVFASESYSGVPFDYKDALGFPGAWDVGYAKWLFEVFHMYELNPCELVLNQTSEIRAACSKTNEKFVIYAPFMTEIQTNLTTDKYDLTVIDLSKREIHKAFLCEDHGLGLIQIQPFNSDELIIGTIR